MKKNDLILGVVLIAASIAVIFRYFQLRDHLEQISGSVFFLRFAFILFSLILAGTGVKKIASSRRKEDLKKSVSKDEDI